MVVARNAVHSALWLVLTMLCLGVFYVIQSGPFIGMAQIIVYTGAIMMLFLFVLMLVGRDASDSLIEMLRGQRVAALVARARLRRAGRQRRSCRALDGTGRGRPGRGQRGRQRPGHRRALFTRYVFAFEVTSRAADHRRRRCDGAGARRAAAGTRSVDQRDRMRARFAPGSYPGPSPARASTRPPPRWPPRPGCPTAARPTAPSRRSCPARADRREPRPREQGR